MVPMQCANLKHVCIKNKKNVYVYLMECIHTIRYRHTFNMDSKDSVAYFSQRINKE